MLTKTEMLLLAEAAEIYLPGHGFAPYDANQRP